MEERPLYCKLVQGRHSGGIVAEKSDIRSNSHIHETVWDGHLNQANLTWKKNQEIVSSIYILMTFFITKYKISLETLRRKRVEWNIQVTCYDMKMIKNLGDGEVITLDW